MSVKKIVMFGISLFWLLLTTGGAASAAATAVDEVQWLRDPFRYVSPAAGRSNRASAQNQKRERAADSQGLQGIFVRNGIYQALFNGQLVTAGGKVGKTLIREIALYSIIIEDGAGRRRIELFHEN
ncbi:MAG: hypothetical protein IBX47_04570 [Desulfuromonadales bacterium]|nr:hypothetical protein [Desulfuromonadales bacterium]